MIGMETAVRNSEWNLGLFLCRLFSNFKFSGCFQIMCFFQQNESSLEFLKINPTHPWLEEYSQILLLRWEIHSGLACHPKFWCPGLKFLLIVPCCWSYQPMLLCRSDLNSFYIFFFQIHISRNTNIGNCFFIYSSRMDTVDISSDSEVSN